MPALRQCRRAGFFAPGRSGVPPGRSFRRGVSRQTLEGRLFVHHAPVSKGFVLRGPAKLVPRLHQGAVAARPSWERLPADRKTGLYNPPHTPYASRWNTARSPGRPATRRQLFLPLNWISSHLFCCRCVGRLYGILRSAAFSHTGRYCAMLGQIAGNLAADKKRSKRSAASSCKTEENGVQ